MSKRILIAPLDWGLGHATRCIPLINTLLKQGHQVAIASSGLALPLLQLEFPQLIFFELPSYKAKYSSAVPFMLQVISQLPHFVRVINKEHVKINEIVSEHKFDLLISDNRYGCYSKKIRSIFITHQLCILMPTWLKWAQPLLNYFNRKYIEKFNECWVPDFENDRVTGLLTHSSLKKVHFIGMLSRFNKSTTPAIIKYDILILLSGPEPQRSIFEEIVINQLQDFKGKVLLVRGRPDQQRTHDLKINHIEVVNHLKAEDLQQAIEASALIIARSGYTTIMDLYYLEKNAVFVPTPGQTEQEYLAKQLLKNKIIYSQPQHEFDLQRAIEVSKSFKGFLRKDNATSLSVILSELI